MENAPAYAALRKVGLANDFIRNFRLLHAGLSHLPQMKEDIRSIGGSGQCLYLWHITAGACLCVHLYITAGNA